MGASGSTPASTFSLRQELLGALPIIEHFLVRLGIDDLLATYAVSTDRRVRLAPAKVLGVLGVLVRNLCVRHQPVYALGEWAASYDPALLGLSASEVSMSNDDRAGRALASLFDADRASMLNQLVLDAVAGVGIDCQTLHNDSTSARLSGAYRNAVGAPRGGKPTVAPARGFSKDHRPDLLQLVWILTVTAEGAVPIAHRIAPRNVEDSTTHIATWDGLCQLLGQCDVLYCADCKLATKENMDHIDRDGGRFVTVLPQRRKEDVAFRTWLVTHEATWTEAMRRPGRRFGDPEEVYETTRAPWPSAEGYRVVWVPSSAKIERDAESRRRRIAEGIAALD